MSYPTCLVGLHRGGCTIGVGHLSTLPAASCYRQVALHRMHASSVMIALTTDRARRELNLSLFFRPTYIISDVLSGDYYPCMVVGGSSRYTRVTCCLHCCCCIWPCSCLRRVQSPSARRSWNTKQLALLVPNSKHCCNFYICTFF
jgi:hypothetical protein